MCSAACELDAHVVAAPFAPLAHKGVNLESAIALLFEMQDERSQSNDDTEKSHDKIMEDMYKKLAANNFEFTLDGQCAIASRWKRRIRRNPELKAKYEATKGRDAKTRFRAEWAKGEHEAWQKNKVHRVVLSEKQIKEGVFYPVARIAVEEGGGESGNRASLHYALYCIQMGPPYVKYHRPTRSIKFLYYVDKTVDTFETSWEQHQKYRVAQINKEDCATGRGLSGETTVRLCERPGASKVFVCGSFQ